MEIGSSERALIEVVREDGRAAGEGETGEVITTDLANHCMPFIRYRVGDIAAVDPAQCACGRGLPLLASIQGRSNDHVVTRDGTRVHHGYFIYLLADKSWIEQFQVVQESREEIVIHVGTHENPVPEDVEWLKSILRKKFGDMKVRIEFARDLPTMPSGKLKYVINKVLE